MPVTFLLLQLANLALAAATAWTFFRNPHLWEGQALAASACAGGLLACLTVLLLGIYLLLAGESRKLFFIVHLALALGCAAGQGYVLYLLGRDVGILHIFKSRFGG